MSETLITPKRLREKLGGVSDMTIWRHSNKPDSDFPLAVLINGRKFYREAEIDEWIASRPRKQPGAAGPRPGSSVENGRAA
ncbi:MAG: hypothetical protein Q8M31_08760 [Beijerinckiaceae bacterium]|nr:hypothetical protein [Beijerinckiaceae bacterium]